MHAKLKKYIFQYLIFNYVGGCCLWDSGIADQVLLHKQLIVGVDGLEWQSRSMLT